MTHTSEASQIKLGDQIRDDSLNQFGSFFTVIEYKLFRHGTRVWVRLDNGSEHTFVSSTTLVINCSL